MPERQFTERLLGPEQLEPSDPRLEVVGACNPGAVEYGSGVALMVRVVERPVEQGDGYLPAPRYTPDGQLEIDWLPEDDVDAESDPRCYTIKSTGQLRLRFVSHLRVFFSPDGRHLDPTQDDQVGPRLMPTGAYETYGIEDPRITPIAGTSYMTVVAVSPHGVSSALLSTTDFNVFTRHGLIFCPDNKDVLLFPEKAAGDYIALHRPMPSMPFGSPEMWIARSADLVHWGAHRQLFGGQADGPFRDRVGGSTPPILTDRGFLTLFHGSDKPAGKAGVGKYTSGAMLLDATNPERIVGMSRGQVLEPVEDFERKGFVDNVVFPSGAVRRGASLYVYYGAADQCCGVTAFDLEELLDSCERV
ncbi:MAG: hypothetical protein AAF288_05600 [Planctomycetota bacterium]